MKQYLSIGEAANYIGCSISTLRRMEKDKRLIPDYRTIGFHRKYHINSFREFIGLPHNDERQVVAYARVSTQKQKKDLVLQQQRLNDYYQKKSFEQEFCNDVLEVLTVFSAKLYGSRSKIHKKT